MNEQALQAAVEEFYRRYPSGFDHPDLVAIGKKHKMDKMIALARESFAEENFSRPDDVAERMIKVVTSSSMVSVFEKPKFRDCVRSMGEPEKVRLVSALREQLHGDERTGFEELVETLAEYKLAKWTLVTVVPAYLRPDYDVFVKPTTVKHVIAHFELPELVYNARPNYDFYNRYRGEINRMKSRVSADLQRENAVFCGFLMMSMDRS